MRDAMRLLWRLCSPDLFTCYIVKNSAPSTKGINNAAVMSAKTAQEALDWAKATYAAEAPDRQAAAELDRRVAESQIAGMDFATAQAREAANRNRTVFQPVEDRIVGEAMDYDTPARRAEAANRAAADVESAAGMAVADMNRDLMRRGGSVDDGGARGNALDLALGKARMRAGASDAAVRNVEAQGHARRMDAAGLGRGVVSNQATQQQIATQAGSGAVNASNAALSATMAGHGVMQTGFQQNMQGVGQAGNLYTQAANVRNTSRGQDLGFASSIFGSFMSSSKKVKKNRKPADEEGALAEINALDVQDFEYDPAKGGPPGMGPQTGPMAEQVHAVMGDRVAPAGKGIEYGDATIKTMGGKLIAGMQALTKRMERLEGRA